METVSQAIQRLDDLDDRVDRLMEKIERKVREYPEHLTFRIGDYFPELAKLK